MSEITLYRDVGVRLKKGVQLSQYSATGAFAMCNNDL
jgi:hypothetical protein